MSVITKPSPARALPRALSISSLLLLAVFLATPYLPLRKRMPHARQSLLHARKHPTATDQVKLPSSRNSNSDIVQRTLVTQSDKPSWEKYPYNSRTFCLTSAMCMRPPTSPDHPGALYFAAARAPTECLAVGPSLEHAVNTSADCRTVQQLVYSAHGSFPSDDPERPLPPAILPLSALTDGQRQSAVWLPAVAVVIPAYPHHFNIFHYAFAVAQAMHVTTALPGLLAGWAATAGGQESEPPARLPVTLVFRGQLPSTLGVWQKQVVTELLLPRLRDAGVHVRQITSFNDTAKMDVSRSYTAVSARSQRVTCARASVLMGQRSDVFTWPFASGRAHVSTHGMRVPIEALSFRAFAYRAAGVRARLSRARLARGAARAASALVVDLPPRVVGYARRNREGDAVDGRMQLGTTRRFSDADERWFVTMLREEAHAVRMRAVTVQTGEHVRVRAQIRAYAGVGVMVGIHGANLVNTAFMMPFGALVEIANVQFRCYRAGMNGGLWFGSHKPARVASREESACVDNPCAGDANHRRVLVEGDDRRALRRLVRQGIAHVDALHRRFGKVGGIPVVYDDALAEYSIDWRNNG